jgi:hypothetical protein
LGRDVEITRGPGNTLQADFLSLFCQILLYIRLGALEDDLSFSFCGLTIQIEQFLSNKDMDMEIQEIKSVPKDG